MFQGKWPSWTSGGWGFIDDPETGQHRTVWALIIVLSHSRHCFVWPTFSQKLEEVIAGLEAAWAFFGGIPKYLVIDNFPAAVAGADALHPRLTRGFLEYSQHRGFITDPARVRHPKDKPHVGTRRPVREGALLQGQRLHPAWQRCEDEAARWCREVAGQRTHGTTRRKPLQVFQDEEHNALIPWGGDPYEVTDWRTAKVHPDHHVACQYALYSAPSALCPPGQQVEIGLGRKLVRIYHRGKLVKIHPRQPRGGRSTDPADYPTELTAYTLRAPEGIKRRAGAPGSRGRRWPNSPTGFSTVPYPGPGYARATSSCAWDNAIPRSAWTSPAAGLWRWTSSTWAGWSASCSRPWECSEAPEHPTPLPAGTLRPARLRLRPCKRRSVMTRTTELTPLLKRLQLGPMAATLPERIALARREQLDYASFLEIILSDEVNRRADRRIELRLQGAGFEETCRLEDFRLDRRLLDAVFSLEFLAKHEHVLLVGPAGVGKSFLAQALGYAAVRAGYTVRFVRADDFFKAMAQARVDNSGGPHLPVLPVPGPADPRRPGASPAHRSTVGRPVRAHPHPSPGVQLRHHQQPIRGRMAEPLRRPHPG